MGSKFKVSLISHWRISKTPLLTFDSVYLKEERIRGEHTLTNLQKTHEKIQQEARGTDFICLSINL